VGNDAVLNAINAVKAPASFASLKSKFLEASVASDLKESTKMSLLQRLIKKAFHAQAKVASVAYRAQNTADRHVAGASSQAFRQSLMAKMEKKQKKYPSVSSGMGGDSRRRSKDHK
jgi:predicted transcriptional regulator